MKPIHVAIFAVIVIFLGAMVSFWLQEEIDAEPVTTLEPERKAKVVSDVPKLVVKSPRTRTYDDGSFDITYTLVNESSAPLNEPTRVVIFPFRYATKNLLGTEAPVDEGEAGWNISVGDTVAPLGAGEQVQRKIKVEANPNFEQVVSYLPFIHFQIEGHPQSKN